MSDVSKEAGNADPSVQGEAAHAQIKLIAFYLPQFHPIPENDAWWGRGFTEWTNATKAAPQFPGHYQPHLPTDLGFYDLRLRQSRHDQIALAEQFGIDGFCYHYYWFSGKRLLHEPLDDMLADPASDMPFCLCWANENWTRRWDAAEHEVLIAQKYGPTDDLDFIKALVPIFRDARYIRVEGAPLLIVYRPQHLPDAKKTADIWRAHCASVGIPRIHICCAFTHGNWDYRQFGFDGGVEFPPHNMEAPNLSAQMPVYEGYRGYIFDYKDVADFYLQRKYGRDHDGFRTVFPSWDNTARTAERALIGLNGTPENYEYWLSQAIARTREDYPGEERLVFINAWNEWAEGCHLEPCRRYGRQFLEATALAKAGKSRLTHFADVGFPMIPAEEAASSAPAVLAPRSRKHSKLGRHIREGITRPLRRALKRAARQTVGAGGSVRRALSEVVSGKGRSEVGAAHIMLEVKQLSELTSEVAAPDEIRSNMAAAPYRFTLRPSRKTDKHKGYRVDFSSGTPSTPLPDTLSRGEEYDTYDQTFGVFANVLAYPALGCVIPSPGTIIYETDRAAAVWPRDRIDTPGMIWNGDVRTFDPAVGRPEMRIAEPCLYSIHGSSGAYGHWMSDTIPSVWLWRKQLVSGEVKLLLPYQQLGWFTKILDALGVPGAACIQPTCRLAALDCAIVAKSCGMGNVVSPPDIMSEIGDSLVRSIDGDRARPGRRRIYLVRGRSAHWPRPVTNEAEIIQLLQRFGFEIIDPAAMSFLDQVRLFSDAAIVVSAHGSALVNVIFAPIDCKIIDLMPERWLGFEYSYRWIYRLTNILRQEYALLLTSVAPDTESFEQERLQSHRPFSSTADLAALERAVRGCL